MGKMYKPVKVHWNGSVDGLIGYSRYGGDYFRMHANSVANPNTNAQQDARALFAGRSEAVALLNPGYKIGLKNFVSDGKGPRAICTELNRENVTGNREAITINYSQLVMSKGSCPLPYNIVAVAAPATHTLTLSWTDNSGIYGAEQTDELFVQVINTIKKAKIYATGFSRADETAEVNYPAGWAGDTLYAYIMINSKAGESSDTKQAGPFTA